MDHATNPHPRPSYFASAALAAVASLALTSGAFAQGRVGNDGRALDANNRIGSGGMNAAPIPPHVPSVTGNQIVTGNVSQGREFRGRVPYSSQYEFRGTTATRGLE